MGFFYVMEKLYTLFKQSTGVQTDTRGELANKLFFCLRGSNFDGNTFAAEALEKGALAVVVDDIQLKTLPGAFYVENTLKALQQLANYHRKQFSIPIIGITGSNGKTTSKELIHAVLSTTYNCHFTKGNLNNHIGVPLTLLQLDETHEIAVIEMGANKPGDIQELVDIAEPTHGIITNVGRAHLEGFGSLEGVIQTKTELYRFLQAHQGTLFVHSDNSILIEQSEMLNLPTVKYGTDGAINAHLIALSPFVEMTWTENDYQSPVLKTHLVGEYNFINFMAAICIGRFFQVSAENCNTAISNYIPTNNRSQVTKTAHNTLIVDCYNANPTSMESAINSFHQMTTEDKVFILGDMREMGNESKAVHFEILQHVKKYGLKGFFVGTEFSQFKDQFPEFAFVETTTVLYDYIQQHPIKNFTVLLKGSRGIALEKLIEVL